MLKLIFLAGLPGFIEFVMVAIGSFALFGALLAGVSVAIGNHRIKKNMDKMTSELKSNYSLAIKRIELYEKYPTKENYDFAKESIEKLNKRKDDFYKFYESQFMFPDKKFDKLISMIDKEEVNMVKNFNFNKDFSVNENNSLPLTSTTKIENKHSEMDYKKNFENSNRKR